MLVSELRWHRRVVLFCGLLLAAPAMADYKTDYAKGLKAAASGDWAEVETVMRDVIAASSTPQARVRLYGQRFEAYVPQYYLGLAAYKQGDCGTAVRWFGDASVAPIISENSELRGIADQAMRECNTKLAAAKPAPTKPAPPPVQPPVQPPVKPVVNTLPTKPAQQNAPPTINTPPPVSVPPLPVTLQTLLDDYLAGRYSKAATADANTVQGVARFHALLLRSAARHALFEIQVTDATAQKSAAESDVRIAKTLAPGKSPDAAFFSPRYRKFFSEVR